LAHSKSNLTKKEVSMTAPLKLLVPAIIVAVALGGLGFVATSVAHAQPPATPSCFGTPTMSGMDMGSMTSTMSPAAMATPGADRQTHVAAAGAQVMPFDLNRTTHMFTDLPDGGREIVTANDPTDTEQIALIRAHLQMEADKFSAGDFADPAAIHGNRMPGLAQLKAGFTSIEFHYEALPNGASITYRSADPTLVTALHVWFAVQRSDHGSC
jgi:hypothetical protein